jgi:hypothetical protein
VQAWPESITASTREKKLVSLGNFLIEFGKLPISEFQEAIRSLYLGAMTNTITRLENLLKQFGSNPEFWRSDLKAQIDELRAATKLGRMPAPTDLVADPSMGDEILRIRKLIEQFGYLLCWWPAICEGARILADKEIRLGRRL